MKPILIGTDNPHKGEPLEPWPPGCSGWRLWKMLHDTCGMSEDQYRLMFDRRNLEDGIIQIPMGSTAVLLGEKVRQHFRLDPLLIHPQVRDGVIYRQIPHPSGRNLFYNDSLMRQLVGMMLEDLCLRNEN